MRLGIATPLPPERSGIADYALDLVEALGRDGIDVEVYARTVEQPQALRAGVRVHPLGDMARRWARREFDVPVYQIGNNVEFHEEIYRLALDAPGLIVLHETMLHHLVRGMTLARGRAEEFVEEMRYAAGPTGQAAAERLLATHYPIEEWSFPLFERLVDRSRAVLVHSDFALSRLRRSRPAATAAVAPFPVDLEALRIPETEERVRVRKSLGIEPGEFVVGSFGLVTPVKHLEPALESFARFRREVPESRFVLVGEVSPYYDLGAVLDRLGREGVQPIGRVELEDLHRWMQAVDLAVNPRHPTGGEVSATLFRLLALGRPAVVTAAGSFLEIPAGAVLHVEVGPAEVEELEAIFRWAWANPELLACVGRQGRGYLERHHGFRPCAAAYRAMAARALAMPDPPLEAAPPLGSHSAADARIRLLARAGGAAADLGVGEGDPVLVALAEKIAGLGWAPKSARKPV